MDAREKLHQMMTPAMAMAMKVMDLTDAQCEAVLEWGLYNFGLGQHVVSEVSEVKYDGRLVILEDGTRWEVESYDAPVAELWDLLDKVVVIDDRMYRIEDAESVVVEQEL